MRLEFEYGHGTMGAELPDNTDIFIPGETVKDPEYIPEDRLKDAYLESLEDEFGPCLIRERNPVLLTYLDWWEELQNKILKEVLTYPNRRDQVEEELRRIRDVRRRMDTDRGGAV